MKSGIRTTAIIKRLKIRKNIPMGVNFHSLSGVIVFAVKSPSTCPGTSLDYMFEKCLALLMLVLYPSCPSKLGLSQRQLLAVKILKQQNPWPGTCGSGKTSHNPTHFTGFRSELSSPRSSSQFLHSTQGAGLGMGILL